MLGLLKLCYYCGGDNIMNGTNMLFFVHRTKTTGIRIRGNKEPTTVLRRLPRTSRLAYRLTSLLRNNPIRLRVSTVLNLPRTTRLSRILHTSRRHPTKLPLNHHRTLTAISPNIPQVFRRRQVNTKEQHKATRFHHNAARMVNMGRCQAKRPHTPNTVVTHKGVVPSLARRSKVESMDTSSKVHQYTEGIKEDTFRSSLHRASMPRSRPTPTMDRPFHTDLIRMVATHSTRCHSTTGSHRTNLLP